jgi:uncharacterized integral membrane protein
MANEITSKWETETVLVFYSNNKEIAKWEYKDDKVVSQQGKTINGVVKRYDTEGLLRAEDNYANNKENGISKTYYKSGALESTQPYKDSLQDGLTTWYGENGEIEKVEVYADGQLVETKNYEVKEVKADKTTNSKYSNLEKIISWNNGLGYLYLIVGIVVGILIFIITARTNISLALLFGGISFVIGWTLFVITLASAELIKVLIDIEANTSKFSTKK